jgi:hypothetical protein
MSDRVVVEVEAGDRARLAVALDPLRLDEIARLAALASSYWRSIEAAADRGDILTVAVHCNQVAMATRSAFALVKTLGDAEAQL